MTTKTNELAALQELRHEALRLAAAHYGKKASYTSNPEKIVDLAREFFKFLTNG